MESLSIGHLIPSVQAHCPTRRQSAGITSEDFTGDTLFARRIKKQNGCSRLISRSRRSLYQDFQEFAKPSHLLPATEVTTYPMHASEDIISSLELDQLSSFYVMELRTSRDFGSCLRDLNAAILLCLIDENGKSILQRISALSLECLRKDKDTIISEYIPFQRGSVDLVTFKGPKLEKIAALWIGLESGSWRVDTVGIKVISASPTTTSLAGEKESSFAGMQYKFEGNSLPLGDGGLPVAELRPILVTQMVEDDISALSSFDSSRPTQYSDAELSKEGSMREYADLKFSLLLYDIILIIICTTILAVSSIEVNAYSFLAGGIGGFLYLLLLQRSVDGLSVPLSSAEDVKLEDSLQSYGGLKKPAMSLAFVMAAIVVSSKYWMGATNMVFSPAELFAGVAGFLTCKIAVVLAAFKPIQMTAKEKKIE
ncbi:hypothetical protein KFK09_027363 [Dendrobium nobile]|uniref:DUF7755 domain-containing protein n=1 Tax=Dendrobium nobile TaxID=94219 RepID=A0A8T3A9H2_DENNO|nr:hypothetical protein KFK09_027363 [Dendrobium nobile]